MNGNNIKRSDRVFFVGATGSGKSVLARMLSEYVPYLVVVDPKWDWQPGPLTSIITGKVEPLLAWPGRSQIIYRPDEMQQDAGLPDFWAAIWKIGNVIVLCDELVTITGPTIAPRGMRRAIQMGRSKGIGVWGITQRPAMVPRILMSEAQHYFVGRLALKDDRSRMADLMQSPQIADRPIEEDYDFWYASASGRDLRTVNSMEIRRN